MMEKSAPLVSVIMPVYNGERFLAEAVDSILTQTYTNFELLIVDDGSTDASARIIREYAARDCRIRFLQHERNLGPGSAQNTGLAVANGALIANMDSDDISLPLRLEKQVRFLENHPKIGALGVCAQAKSEDMATSLFEFNVPQEHALIAFNLFHGASFVGPTVVVRAQFLNLVGGYTNDRMKTADLDLACRLLCQTSIQFANLPECLYLYRRHKRAIGVATMGEQSAEERGIRAGLVRHLWGEAPPGVVDRFQSLRFQRKLNWLDRRAAKSDMRRLIDALIVHNCVDPEDRPLLIAEVNRRLEQASPRIWQQICHWRRHHFTRGEQILNVS
ncbi:MAG: glycosyltransferase family 2 protein, partial [Chloroflexota bacterium]|nr:glycosyltransferase family 2 protein [Chloroflexota bacterium]